MCRAELTPGPDKLWVGGFRLYLSAKQRVERSDGPWDRLAATQSRTILKVIQSRKIAAGQGHAEAQFNLGYMYAQGQDVPQGDKEALMWYRKSADQGHSKAHP